MPTIAQAFFEEGFQEEFTQTAHRPAKRYEILRSFLKYQLKSCQLSLKQHDLINKANSKQLQQWIDKTREGKSIDDVITDIQRPCL